MIAYRLPMYLECMRIPANAATDSGAMLAGHRSAATRVLDYLLVPSLSVNRFCRLCMESPFSGMW